VAQGELPPGWPVKSRAELAYAVALLLQETDCFWRHADGTFTWIQKQRDGVPVPDKKKTGEQEIAVREAAQTANRVTATVLPDGVNILSAPRIGDAAKGTAQERLDQAYAEGFLTQEEFRARQEAAQAAKTQQELDALAADLGKVPGPCPVPVKAVVKRRVHPAVALLPAIAFYALATDVAVAAGPWFLVALFTAAGVAMLTLSAVLALRRG
jgi:uncharacterized protein GlcG (DUF336 family)